MPTISMFYGILIQMFWDQHAPPHFHASYGEFKAIIDIRDLVLSDGKLPRRASELVLDWAELHQAELLEDWDLPSKTTSQTYCTLKVKRRLIVKWDVIEITPCAPRAFTVRFADGLSGSIHISRSFCTGVFQPLLDDETLAQARVENGVVVWPNGLDLAPDTMYREIQRSDERCYLVGQTKPANQSP